MIDPSARVVHREVYAWPPGVPMVAYTGASGAAFDFAVECGAADRGSADLVAASVNGLLAHGALPRTLAVELRGDDAIVDDLMLGVERGCRAHSFRLVECTHVHAQRPAVALRALGARQQELPGAGVGDAIHAAAAPGLQGVGIAEAIALLRRAGSLDTVLAPLGSTPRQALMAQPRTYLGIAHDPLREGCWRALVPIGDGGLVGSLAAVLPAGLGAELDLRHWRLPPLHAWLCAQSQGDLAAAGRTFGLGIGMLMLVAERHEARVQAEFKGWSEPHTRIGRVVEGSGVRIDC